MLSCCFTQHSGYDNLQATIFNCLLGVPFIVDSSSTSLRVAEVAQPSGHHLRTNAKFHIYAASSIDDAIEDIDNHTLRANLRTEVTAIRGLTLNYHTPYPSKDLTNLLVNSNISNNIIWHDVLSNSLSKNPSNETFLTSSQLLKLLKQLAPKISAIVYCQRENTTNIFPDLLDLHKETGIVVIDAQKLTQHSKRNSAEFKAEISRTHLNQNLELLWLRTVINHVDNLRALTTTRRGKKKPPRP